MTLFFSVSMLFSCYKCGEFEPRYLGPESQPVPVNLVMMAGVYHIPESSISRHCQGTGNCNRAAVYFSPSSLLTVGKEKEEEKNSTWHE